jgi:UDP-2,3-diacylglucosamine pyrophosphatase LpxH
MTETYNTLVISDLHLGEDLKPSSRRRPVSTQLDILERELVSFLRHYTYSRRDGLPWRLVINGDLVDFLGICLLPGAEHQDVVREDHVFGLRRKPRVARAKMEAVVDRHPQVFRALGRFLAAGHRVDIVAGNHDVEFHWAPVQRAFKEGVQRAYEAGQLSRARAITGEQVADRISFHPWFFYEPGVVWVEHGHLYDENCSFHFHLDPAHPESRELDVNVDGAASRYVLNYIPEADYGQENWSSIGYMRWALSLGPRGMFNLVRGYWAFSARLLQARRQRARMPGAAEARRERHRERLRKLCETWSLGEETLGAVDDLRKKPVIDNLWRLLQVLMLDKIFIAAVTLLFLMVVVAALPMVWATVAASAVVGSAWLANGYLGRGRNIDPTGPLLVVPERIRRHVDARYVVFGHTHEPLAVVLDNDGMYFNSGTWFPDENPGLLRSFTHVMVYHTDTGPRAELFQWRDGASRVFTPGFNARAPRPVIASPRPVVKPVPALVDGKPSALEV